LTTPPLILLSFLISLISTLISKTIKELINFTFARNVGRLRAAQRVVARDSGRRGIANCSRRGCRRWQVQVCDVQVSRVQVAHQRSRLRKAGAWLYIGFEFCATPRRSGLRNRSRDHCGCSHSPLA
jgi:hypothetical protein